MCCNLLFVAFITIDYFFNACSRLLLQNKQVLRVSSYNLQRPDLIIQRAHFPINWCLCRMHLQSVSRKAGTLHATSNEYLIILVTLHTTRNQGFGYWVDFPGVLIALSCALLRSRQIRFSLFHSQRRLDTYYDFKRMNRDRA